MVGTLELDRDLGGDLLVEAHLEAVQVDDLAAQGMVLLLLDHDRDGLAAPDLQVEQRLAFGEQRAQLALRHLERLRLAALPVDDAGDKPLPAQAAGGPRAEALARRDVECGAGGSHGSSFPGWDRGPHSGKVGSEPG